MIQVRIAGLSLDPVSEQPVLLLVRADDPSENPRLALPIWIGHAEASAILLGLQGIEAPRPMTHDLLHDAIEALGHTVARVEITQLDSGTFYASVILHGDDRDLVLDARPSDSVALAVRAGCPIFVAEDVFAEAVVEVTEIDEEEEVEKFRDFLDHVDPSDFMS
ncbi:MAG: bifunctional nuclease family protein [Coriobacteriia bacterium]|nr:bifunctional nuclease family protein [Coriobacteriia bacterium]MBN2841033.1 bifunctional nuclease family protein [Coriobacteriia bacterium]